MKYVSLNLNSIIYILLSTSILSDIILVLVNRHYDQYNSIFTCICKWVKNAKSNLNKGLMLFICFYFRTFIIIDCK